MPTAPQLLKLSRLYDAARRLSEDGPARAAYFLLVTTVAFWPTLAAAHLLNDFRDAQYCAVFEEAARLSVVKFHELPLWDPYYCGGVPGLGTPSAWFASPTFLLTLLFGTLRGDALIGFAMTVIGLEGTYRYVRARGGGSLASMTAAPVYALSGVFAHTGALGWTHFYGFELVPWALLGIRLALGGSRRGLVLAALAVGWMIGFGGTYTGPLTALAGALEVFFAVAQVATDARRVAYTLGMAALVGLLAAGMSVVRLWPVAETLASSPRIIGGTGGLSRVEIWRALFGTSDNHFLRADFLIGLPVLPLVIAGAFRKRSLPVVMGLVIWVWLALGYKLHTSLFALLRGVPPYTMLRAPERFLVFVALVAAALIAVGIRKLEALGRRKGRYLLLALVCYALVLADTGVLITNARAETFARPMVPPPPVVDRPFHQSRGNRWVAAYYPFMSRGTLSCFDDYNVAQAPELRGDLEQEEYLASPDDGTVTETSWSPDRIELHAELTRAARVYVNQNWHPGWRSTAGVVVSDGGLLAVDLPAGTTDLTLRFLSRSALAGLGTLGAALLVAGVLVWRARKGDLIAPGREALVTAALCASPFAVTLLAAVLIHEPRRPPPPLVTPSGEPMIVEAPPEGSLPVEARWDGIVLEASTLTVEPVGDTTSVTVELDWRLSKKPPPGLGVFVRFEKAKDHFNADHVLLSDLMALEDAPIGKTVRDVAAVVVIPPDKAPGTWNVYAGLWRARRDGQRLRILGGINGTVSDNRVQVGSFTVEP